MFHISCVFAFQKLALYNSLPCTPLTQEKSKGRLGCLFEQSYVGIMLSGHFRDLRLMKRVRSISEAPPLYRKYHIDRDYELLSLFEQLVERYDIQSVLYPGCYVHIAPSLCIPRAVYIDCAIPAKKFFDDPMVCKYIDSMKSYRAVSKITFYHQSYEEDIAQPEESFDLLISQYAGFVSEATKKYLKKGGILVANDSHGDAGLAAIDPSFELIAVANNRNNRFVISDKNLRSYFKPKKEVQITKQFLKDHQKGLVYSKVASNYIFGKIK